MNGHGCSVENDRALKALEHHTVLTPEVEQTFFVGLVHSLAILARLGGPMSPQLLEIFPPRDH